MLSIITPVLNGCKYIQSNIESIWSLSIPFEHIIVDGGSTDGTIDLVKKYPEIKLLHQKNKKGMYSAIHQGIIASNGEYITWVNSDDTVIRNGYEEIYKQTYKKKADIIYSNGIHNYIEKYYYKKIYAKFFCRYLLKEGVFPFVQPSVVFSRKAYDIVGGFNYESFRLIGDRDLFQRMAYADCLKFLYVPVFSSVFMRYDDSLLYRNIDQIEDEYKYCIKTNVNQLNRVIFHLSQYLRPIFDYSISCIRQ